MSQRVDQCKTCKASILWMRHARTGRAAPIDAEPTEKGNIAIDIPSGTYVVLPRNSVGNPLSRYTNHWQTCPDRVAWKEKQKT